LSICVSLREPWEKGSGGLKSGNRRLCEYRRLCGTFQLPQSTVLLRPSTRLDEQVIDSLPFRIVSKAFACQSLRWYPMRSYIFGIKLAEMASRGCCGPYSTFQRRLKPSGSCIDYCVPNLQSPPGCVCGLFILIAEG
jgi:hypothetical protein